MKKLTLFISMILAANLTFAQWIQQNPYPGNSEIRFNDIFFHDQNLGWVGGGEEYENRCFITIDGGNSWEWMLVWVDGMATGVHFSDENNGWICTDGNYSWQHQMAHSTNGGVGLEGWLPQDIEISPSHELASVFFIDSLTGWTVSNGGELTFGSALFKTYNGGNNWTQIHYSSWTSCFDIIFLNDFKGFKVGDSFCRSYDGGATWDCFEIDMDCGYALEVIDENRIWIAGAKDFPTTGNIRLSNDEGTTWMEIVGDSIPVMNDIKFIGPNLGWAVGNEGTILHTANGGETCEYQESGTTADLFSISFVDENHGWICGDSSIILSTSNGGITGLDTQVQTSNFDVRCFPNPVSDNCLIDFDLANPARVSIQIYNNMGELLIEAKNQIYSTGSHQVNLNLIDLNKGIYFCRVQVGNELVTKKIIKVK